jgi:hypothetical protein
VTRVKDLERLLRQHGVDPGTADEDAGAVGTTKRDDQTYGDEVKNNPHDPRDWTLDHLVGDDAGMSLITGRARSRGPASSRSNICFPTPRTVPA